METAIQALVELEDPVISSPLMVTSSVCVEADLKEIAVKRVRDIDA